MDCQVDGIGILGAETEKPTLIRCAITWDPEYIECYLIFLDDMEKVLFGRESMPINNIEFMDRNIAICNMFFPHVNADIIPIKVYLCRSGYTILRHAYDAIVYNYAAKHMSTSSELSESSDISDSGNGDEIIDMEQSISEETTDIEPPTKRAKFSDSEDIEENNDQEQITKPTKKRGWFSWLW